LNNYKQFFWFCHITNYNEDSPALVVITRPCTQKAARYVAVSALTRTQ